jgi:plastocyanin
VSEVEPPPVDRDGSMEVRMRMKLAMRVSMLALIAWAPAIPASADEDLLLRFTPEYAGVEEAHASRNGDLGSLGSSHADADVDGTIDLEARVEGTTPPAVLGAASPTASASASVEAPSFDWAGNELRLEARFSYRVQFQHTTDARVDPLLVAKDDLSARVMAGFEGETPFVWTEGWSSTSSDGEIVSASKLGVHETRGFGTLTNYVRVPCDGTTLTPYVEGSVVARMPSPQAGVERAGRSVVLELFVSEIAIYRDRVMPCHDIADIEVHDDFFEPKDVAILAYNAVRFDFDSAARYHDVIVPGHGSAYPGDPIEMYLPGVYTYYCSVHGTADGAGMAGTITVT